MYLSWNEGSPSLYVGSSVLHGQAFKEVGVYGNIVSRHKRYVVSATRYAVGHVRRDACSDVILIIVQAVGIGRQRG